MARLDDYLGSLPSGLGSYPAAEQKASILRFFLDHTKSTQPAFQPQRGPPELLELLLRPPPVNTWITEAQAQACFLWCSDQLFPADDEGYVRHWRDVNTALLQSSLYRFLMRLASPGQIIKGAKSRWHQLHRSGLDLAVEADGAELALRFPSMLLPRIAARTLATGFTAAVRSGSAAASVELADHTVTHARFKVTGLP